MRRLFFLLLAVNGVLFALLQFAHSRGGESMAGHEPLHAEQIKLLDDAEVATLPVAKPAAPAPKTTACFQWGDFAAGDVGPALKALEKFQLGDKVARQKLEKTQGWWVYIPPRKTQQEAQKKVVELKQLGVEDSYVIQDGSRWRNAISLGIFSTAEAANRFLAQLKDKGVKSAMAGARTHETDLTRLLVRDVGQDTGAELAKLAQDFSSTELKTVDCKPSANGAGQ
jgi:hypothetical protein